MLKIRVENFQSIEDSEIEVSGLTVITGTNNGGKSALHRAVFGAVTNARGTKFVRHGKDQCTVTLTFGDGRTLVWEKGDKINSYTVDGKTLNKVGAGAPPPEVQALGIVPIEAAGRELWPQFAHQFTGQVFLLDQPGSVLAESIADVTRVGVLNEALRNTQSDRRAQGAELKVRVSDVAKLEALESTYSGLDVVEMLAREAEALDREVVTLQEQLAITTSLRDDIETFTDAVGDLLPARWIEMPLSGRAYIDDLKALTEVQELASKLAAARAVQAQLSPVAAITLPDDALVVRAEKVADAITLLRGLRDRMAPLLEVVREGVAIRDALSIPLLDAGVPMGQMQTLETLRQLQRDLATRSNLTRDLKSEAATLETQYEEALHEVRDLLGGVGDCPICGRC